MGLNRLAYPLLVICIGVLLMSVMDVAIASGKKKKASWYGTTAQGKRTASREIFNRNDFTAAHKKLPFGTVVRVTTPESKRQVLVAITDRGPVAPSLIVDVSKRAAAQLEMIQRGVMNASLQIISDASGSPLNQDNGYYLRLTGRLSSRQAHDLVNVYTLSFGIQVQALREVEVDNPGYVLAVGPFTDFNTARKEMLAISQVCAAEDIIEAPLVGGTLLPGAPVFESRSKHLVSQGNGPKSKKATVAQVRKTKIRIAQAD